jgi:hypothetical protein
LSVKVALTEPDEETAWEPVSVLHWRGTREVLDAAIRLGSSGRAEERRLAANILGQIGCPERTFPVECFDALAGMLSKENNLGVLERWVRWCACRRSGSVNRRSEA